MIMLAEKYGIMFLSVPDTPDESVEPDVETDTDTE